MDKKYIKAKCVDCGKKLSKNKCKRCKRCSGKENGKNKARNEKISISKRGDRNSAKKPKVRKKISNTLKRKYKNGEIVSPFVKNHNINTGRKHSQKYKDERKGEKNPFFGKKHTVESKDKFKRKRRLWKTPLKDTSIEVKIQNFLKQLKIEFLTHKYMKIKHGYQCDVFIPSMNIIIECDGDYWHGNPKKFPDEKLTNTIIQQREKDKIRTNELINNGFKVIRLWECEIKKFNLNDLNGRLKNAML